MVLLSSVLVLLAGSTAAHAAWGKISVSRTLLIDDQPYYLPTEAEVILGNAPVPGEIVPFTAINTDRTYITGDILSGTLNAWKEADDVYSDSFLRAVLLIRTGRGRATVASSATDYLSSKGVEKLLLSGVDAVLGKISTTRVSGIDLPAGPYVFAKDPSGKAAIYKPLKLAFDPTQSFFKSVTPLKNGSFAVVSASLDTDSSPYIGFPSKVYALSKDRSKYPLAGVRVTVKDIYHLQGIKTSAGNRAFYDTYGPRTSTSPAISRLVKLGADIIGTTKTVQFANGDRATADWIDYHASFSVRGDGYREPSGSSTGGGTSVAGLEWVDVSIGSDTGGSIRGPAGANGIYGIRPSVGAISLENVVPLSDLLDTPGYMARDPEVFAKFGKSWYSENPDLKSYASYPKKLLMSSSFGSVNAEAMAMYDDFVAKLAVFLSATVQNFTITEEWDKTSGTDVTVQTYLNETYPTLVSYHQWTAVGTKLFADHKAKNGGREPHVNPAVLSRWKYGQSRGADGYAEEVKRQQVFANWAYNSFLKSDAESCTDAFYLYPYNAGSYSSRETYFLGPSAPPFGFSDGRVAVYARSPDIVIPIGQLPYKSGVTGITEMNPVTISLIARRGCDFVLLDLVKALADKGLVKAVKTGRTAF